MSSLFSGSFVGFAGSRSLAAWFEPAVCSVVDDVLASGRGVAVGCASGGDDLAAFRFDEFDAARIRECFFGRIDHLQQRAMCAGG